MQKVQDTIKVNEVVIGTMKHIKDMTLLVIVMNRDGADEETYEEILQSEGTHTVCDATITVMKDSITIVKDSINLLISLSEANKYETLQDVIYAELLQFLNSVALLYDKNGNERYNDIIYSWYNYAVGVMPALIAVLVIAIVCIITVVVLLRKE